MSQPLVRPGLLRHYQTLAYYAVNRFKGDNYARMRRYFAEVFLAEIEQFVPLEGRLLLDVGGARGEFCGVLQERRGGLRCVNVDIDVTDSAFARTLRASGARLPFADDTFDVFLSRGAIEHVPQDLQQVFLDEAHRVLRPGGTAYVMTQPWYAPHAGHQFRPFHYFPIRVARALKKPFTKQDLSGSNWAEANLYPLTYRKMLRMIERSGLQYVTGLDTHLKLHFLSRRPLLREIGMMSVAFICTKPAPAAQPQVAVPAGAAADRSAAGPGAG